MNKLIQKLWQMRGGVHPAFHKEISTKLPIKMLPIPAQLIIPVHQHAGVDATVIVSVGDKVLKGQPLTSIISGQRAAIIHASTSGTVAEIQAYPLPHASGISGLCVVIDTDGVDQWIEKSSVQPLDAKDMLQRIESAGIVGLGGAVFPSAVKLASTKLDGLDTLIINAAECEPYISCDDCLVRERADEVIAGIGILVELLKAKRCIIGIEDNKPEAMAEINAALKKASGAEQGSAGRNRIQQESYQCITVKSVPTQYPSGDAKQLTQILTGIQIPKDKRSTDFGVLCHNIATAHAVYEAVVHNKPLISRVVTMTGDGIAQPQNVQALFGTPISFIVEQLGGYTDNAERMIMGGPMMGFPLPSDDLPIVKASNCILVSSIKELTLASQQAAPETKQVMPCIRCNKCAQVCPVNLLPQQMYWHARAHDFDKTAEHNLADCMECGACNYVCPSAIPLVDYFRYAKTEIKAQQQATLKASKSRERFEFNEFRKVRIKQERDAKRLAHKDALMKKKQEEAAQSEASIPEGKVGGEAAPEKTDKQDAIKAAMARAKARKAAVKAAENKDQNSDAI